MNSELAAEIEKQIEEAAEIGEPPSFSLRRDQADGLLAALRATTDTVQVPRDLWNEIVDFITDQVDVKDGDDGRQEPNKAMSLSMQIEQAGL